MPTKPYTFDRNGPPLTVTVQWDDDGHDVRVSHPSVNHGQPVDVPHVQINNEVADVDAAVAEFAAVFTPPATVEDETGGVFRLKIRGRPQLATWTPTNPADAAALKAAIGPPKRTIRLIMHGGSIVGVFA